MKNKINSNQLKKILFKVAFCSMACDGSIDQREIEEIKAIHDKTVFFKDLDLSKELELLKIKLKSDGKRLIKDILQDIDSYELNTIQELLILEIALRIINSDKRIDENEIKFINLLRSKMKVHNQTIFDRFGKVEILFTEDYIRTNLDNEYQNKFINNLKFPKIIELKKIKFDEKDEMKK